MKENMENIKGFRSFNESKGEDITLTEDEKKYLWSKMEYNKKKKYTNSENDIFKVLTSESDSTITEEEMIKYLNSLSYSIKKQMKDSDKKFININATTIKSKIPSSWIGVKFSSIPAKRRRDEKRDD